MEILLAYVEDARYEEDYTEARKNGALFEFVLDVAGITQTDDIPGKEFRWQLLDHAVRQLKRKKRQRSGFWTRPDLVLHAVSVSSTGSPKIIRIREALSSWYFARSQWINTGKQGVRDTTVKDNFQYVKVLTQGEYTPERLAEMLIAQSVKITFETQYPI